MTTKDRRSAPAYLSDQHRDGDEGYDYADEAEAHRHTPGPWRVAGTPDTPTARAMRITRYHTIAPEGGPALAVLPDGRRDIQDANARLIAASPDLLEAAKGDHDQECRLVTALRQAQFALEDLGAPAGIVHETRQAADEAELGQIRRNRRAAIAKAGGGAS